jgi:hypothetical protein
MKRIATLAVIAGAALAATSAGTAGAATTHGPYSTKADCVYWAGVYEFHGYVITRNCYGSAGNWRFVTA